METKLVKAAICIFLPVIVFTSCSTPRYVYAPPAQNVPVITQKGDSKIAAYYSTNSMGSSDNEQDTYKDRSNGMDLQGAYAFSDKFALQVSYAQRKEKSQGSISTNSYPGPVLDYKRHTLEAGIGYYMALNVKKSVLFQIFAGFGAGRFQFTDDGYLDMNTTYSRYHEAGINKYFLQPSMIFFNHGFSVAPTTRVTLLKYHNIKTNYTSPELNSYNLEGLSDSPFFVFEPSVTLAYQLKKLNGLRFEMQFGLSTFTNNVYYDVRNLNFSVGTVLDFGKRIF